jgi:hypothetical protein
MRWQEACLKSTYKIAVRQNETHVFLRNWYGACTMHNKKTGNTITAPKDLIEGYNDWMPYKDLKEES